MTESRQSVRNGVIAAIVVITLFGALAALAVWSQNRTWNENHSGQNTGTEQQAPTSNGCPKASSGTVVVCHIGNEFFINGVTYEPKLITTGVLPDNTGCDQNNGNCAVRTYVFGLPGSSEKPVISAADMSGRSLTGAWSSNGSFIFAGFVPDFILTYKNPAAAP